MNAIDKFASLLTLTREPFPASTKATLPGSRPDLRVPVREVLLTNGEQISLYDTSGPYTDPAALIDVRQGLPDVRGAWIGIYLKEKSSHVSVTGNLLSGSFGHGIKIEDASAVSVKDNFVESAKGVGIGVERSTASHVAGNLVTGAGRCGIRSSAKAAVVSGNVVTGHTKETCE